MLEVMSVEPASAYGLPTFSFERPGGSTPFMVTQTGVGGWALTTTFGRRACRQYLGSLTPLYPFSRQRVVSAAYYLISARTNWPPQKIVHDLVTRSDSSTSEIRIDTPQCASIYSNQQSSRGREAISGLPIIPFGELLFYAH